MGRREGRQKNHLYIRLMFGWHFDLKSFGLGFLLVGWLVGLVGFFQFYFIFFYLENS